MMHDEANFLVVLQVSITWVTEVGGHAPPSFKLSTEIQFFHYENILSLDDLPNLPLAFLLHQEF